MTDVKITYDPFESKTVIRCGDHEITSPDNENNKICSYILSYGFHRILKPFRTRYSVWNGLLPELICDVNDDELDIVFEGQASDFEELEAAFGECRELVENAGYTNSWTLHHTQNFNAESFAEKLISTSDRLKEFCDTRSELSELDDFKASVRCGSISEGHKRLASIIGKHIEKWESSSDKYRINNINMLTFIKDDIDRSAMQAERIESRRDQDEQRSDRAAVR